MRLLSLTSSESSFHPVRFNESGLSLVVGRRGSESPGDSLNRTYNGVGKSLMIVLIDFCLGSNSNRFLSEALPDWEFTLRFKQDGQEHFLRRNTSNQRTIIYDDAELGIRDTGRTLAAEIFKISADEAVSFRSIIKRYTIYRKLSQLDTLHRIK